MRWQALSSDGTSVWDLDGTGFDRIDRAHLVRFRLWPDHAIVPLIDIDVPSGSTFIARRTTNAMTGSWLLKVALERQGRVDLHVFEPPDIYYRLPAWGVDLLGHASPWMTRPILSAHEEEVSV